MPLPAIGFAACGLATLVALSLGNLPGLAFLQPNEQLHMRGLSDIRVKNGPGIATYLPLVTRARKRNGVKLDETQYAVVRNSLTAEEITIEGPTLYFLRQQNDGERCEGIATLPTPRAETPPCPCRPHEVLVAGKHGSDLRTKIVLEKQEYSGGVPVIVLARASSHLCRACLL